MSSEDRPTLPAADSKSSCLRAVGISCLVLVVIGLAFGLWIGYAVSKNPMFRKVFTEAPLIQECQLHLQAPRSEQDVAGALERYVRKNDEYPASLEDLYPNFLEDKSVLHCPADPSPKDTVSYEYTRPDMDDPASTVVVECKHHVVVDGEPLWRMTLHKDGKFVRKMNESAAELIRRR